MCRNIKTLYNFEPKATNDEIRNASLQFVRKITGFTAPSKANEHAFNHAVNDISKISKNLLGSLVTNAQSHDREVETHKANLKALESFGKK